MKNGVVVRGASDFHTHLRGGPEEPDVFDMALADEVLVFKRFLAMPNTKGRYIETAEDVRWYREKIMSAAPEAEPILPIYFTPRTTPEMILEAAKAGAKGVKSFPRGGTTNSGDGLTPQELIGKRDHFAAMAEANMVFNNHSEDPSVQDPVERERAFLPYIREIARSFPKLRIVLEHVSTEAGLRFAMEHENVAVTITPHHLVLTTADVIGDHDCLCMPVAKSMADRRAIRQALISGHWRVLPGTDSAPHVRNSKHAAKGAYGIYNTPVAIPVYTKFFAKYDMLDRLPAFLARSEFYQLPPATGEIEIVREEWTVPDAVSDPDHDPQSTVRCFLAGRKLEYRVRTS